jgi:hypothetical protein
MVSCTLVHWGRVQCTKVQLLPSARAAQTHLMNVKALGLVAFALLLAGCFTSASQPQSSCELMTAQICSRAAEAQLHGGTLAVSYSFRPEEARVVPLVVPIVRQDGVLAAEVDCYANTDSRSYSLVRSELAIAPASEESVDFLRDRHLCADDEPYALENRQHVETASAVPLSSR